MLLQHKRDCFAFSARNECQRESWSQKNMSAWTEHWRFKILIVKFQLKQWSLWTDQRPIEWSVCYLNGSQPGQLKGYKNKLLQLISLASFSIKRKSVKPPPSVVDRWQLDSKPKGPFPVSWPRQLGEYNVITMKSQIISDLLYRSVLKLQNPV